MIRKEPFARVDLDLLNRAAARPLLRPQLRDGALVHVGPRLGEAALSTLAADALHLFGSPLSERIRQCPECAMMFVDTSRRGRRCWCSSAQGCGNRAKVRNLRAREGNRRGRAVVDKRVCFDFEVVFSNGGGIQGQDFRPDIEGDDIHDDALAVYIIRDLRLLMVGEVRILNKRIIEERNKRAAQAAEAVGEYVANDRFLDLSHTIESGMITYKGRPAPLICDYLSREQSRELNAEGTESQIGRIDMVANTGTYIDMPFHRYADGHDLAVLPLERVSDVPGVLIRVEGAAERAIDWHHFVPVECRGRAVLVHTGWDRRWRTDCYFEGHPFLTEKAAFYLRDQGAVLVGIDSLNIDDTSGGTRPVHSVLLAAGIPIVEHLTGLNCLPASGFRFSAMPPRIKGMGTFPVRAHAQLAAD